MSKSQKSNKFIRDWRPTGKQYAEAEKGVYESKNVPVLVALVLSLLANLLSVVCFIVSGIDFGLLFVGLMLACDVVFLILFSKLNFCCKYSAGFVALYLVVNVLLTLFSLLFGLSVIGDGSLFTVFGVILRIASILVFTLVLILSVRTARTSKRAVSFSVVLSVLLLGGLVYGQLFYGGYYGQNYSVLNGERAVVYTLHTDEDGEEYYFAKKVLPGLGTSAIVEDTYLGKEVRGVSVDVLSAPRLKAVALKGDRVMYLGAPQEVPEDIKFPNITVQKELVEEYRQQAFDQVTVLRNKLTAAYLPELAEDEVAVRFEYDTAEISAELYNAENVLPVLVLKKGESVELSDLSALMQNYYTQENVLEWSFENAYGWNLLGLQANGEELFSAAINKNVTVKVNFEPVKKVEYSLMDAEYYTPTNFDQIGYISPSAEEVETDYNHREGCSVRMTGNMGVEFSDVDSLRAHAFSDATEGIDTIFANVHYQMITPVIAQFEATAENRQQANSFTYGDELNLEFAVEEHGANITYTLMEGAEAGSMVTLHDNSEVANYFAGVRTPGTQYFYLVARASDVYGNPELYMEAHHTLQFDVQKKTISGVWDLSQLPQQYDSLPHYASYSIDQSQAVTEHGSSVADPISTAFTTTETEACDAGSYTFVATLDDSLLEKYILADHTATHTIARKVVDVSWSETEYTYDGANHVPTASWTLADGSPVSKVGSNEQTNANTNGGKYTTVVEIDDVNHIFASGETTSVQYVINPKTLNVVDSDWTYTILTYNNTKQEPTVMVATGVDRDGTITLDVAGGQINAGGYTATASTTNTNYTLTGATTHTFTIEKATAAVEWTNLSLVFNGNAQLPTAKYATFTTNGAQTGTATAKVAATAESINVDRYTANATAATALDEQNYTLTNTSSDFDITKKSVTATWGTTSFTYNGKAQAPTASYKNVKNQTVNLTISGAQTNAGSGYTASAALETSLEQQNYTLEGTTKSFTIGKASVAAVWSTATFTFDGTQKTLTATYSGFEGVQSLTVTGGTGTNVDSYEATAALTSALEQQNYTLTNASKTLVINKKSVAVVWSNLSLVYNGSEQKPIAKFTDVTNAEQTLSVNKGLTDVGNTTVTAQTTDTNYAYTNTTATFAITPYTINTIEWIGETTYTYNGEVQGLTARYENLAGGYTTAYTTDKVNAGTHTATAQTNDKNYQFASTAEKTKQFTINRATISVSWANTTFTYNGSTQAPTATATGVKGESVNVTVSGGQTNAGTYTATASTSNQNYTLTNNTCQFTIEKKQVSVSSWSNLEQTYTGAALKPKATCSQSSVTLVIDGSLTNVGTTTVTAKLSTADEKNYVLTGETTATFTVKKKQINVVWSGASFNYDGTAKTPTATYSGVTITVSVAAKAGSSLTSGKAVKVGSYTATASTSNQNYEIVNNTFDFTIVEVTNKN